MKKLTFILTLCFAVLNSNSSFAQQSNSLQKITLKQAVDLALKNNFQIKQAENNILSAEETEFAAKMNIFTPDLNANLRFGQTQGRQFNTTTGSIEDQIATSTSGGINTSITLFDGLRNIYSLRSATNSKITQRERLKRGKEDIIFNVATQFLTILLDNQLLGIAQENLKSSNAQLGLIKAQVEVGSRPVADLYNQESLVANSELSVLQRENALSNDKMSLVRLLQIDPSKDYDFEIPEINAKQVDSNVDIQGLISMALANRSDIKAQEANIMTNFFNYKSAIGQYYPSLSFSAGLSTNYNDRLTDRIFDNNNVYVRDEKVPFSDQFFDRNRNLNFSLNLQIPIYNQFAVHSSVARSKIQYKNSQLELENQKLGVAQEVKRAFSDYLSYSKQLESSDKALISAKKALETQQERYKIGSSTLIELTQSNAQFVEVSSNRAQALFRLIFQEQLINYYTGKINSDFKLN